MFLWFEVAENVLNQPVPRKSQMLTHLATAAVEKATGMPGVQSGNRDLQELRRLLDVENDGVALRELWVSEGGRKFLDGETLCVCLGHVVLPIELGCRG